MTENNNNIRNQIYLAALLHDIGKFVFRSQELKKGEGEKLSEQFIRDNFGKIKILQECIEDILNFSCQNFSNEINEQDNKDVRRPIISILSSIDLVEKKTKQNNLYYYLPEIQNLKNVFPVEEKNTNSDKWNYDFQKSIKQHSELFKQFINDIKLLQNIKDINSLSTSLFYLLQKFTSRISSASYKSEADISLFDHSRAFAGLTNCLTYNLKTEDLKTYNPSKVEQKYYLLKGDLTGIQKFIYDNINLSEVGNTKKLAKRLRGRSFYISLLTDFVSELFINEFELAEANLLYAGGGHFNIVIPYTNDADEIINKLVKNINLMLLDKIGSTLCLVVAKTLCENDLFINTNKYISEVNYQLEIEKQKKHINYIEDVIFKSTQKERTDFDDDEKTGKFLPYSDYLIEIKAKNNYKFKDDKNLIISFEKFNTYYFTISNPEKKYTTEYNEINQFFKERENYIENAKLIKINKTDFLEFADYLNKDFDFPITFSYKFIAKQAEYENVKRGINEYPEILNFEELAELNYKENKTLSYPKLAVIRLDIDNLGAIFGLGLGEKSTFSRIATLSRELDLFFSGYMNELTEKYKLYTTYSGGDDAFIVGSWYNILHFAKELYKSFKKFACYNADFTFSAGIFICDPHLPIAKMASKASELEDLSKNYKINGEKVKNAVTVFDVTLSWKEYIEMIDFGDTILKYVKENDENNNENNNLKLARSVIHRVLRIIKSCFYEKEIKDEKGNIKYRKGELNTEKYYSNIAHLHYFFARQGFNKKKIENAENSIEKNDAEKFTNEITNHVIKQFLSGLTKEELIKNYIIPTNYVIMKTRTLNN